MNNVAIIKMLEGIIVGLVIYGLWVSHLAIKYKECLDDLKGKTDIAIIELMKKYGKRHAI